MAPADPRSALALAGEAAAEKFLVRDRRHKLLARRFNCSAGELDLITRDGDTIVFVEVKTQTSRDTLDPEERVTNTKKTRLIRAAKWFLQRKGWQDAACRFDVVAVLIPPDAKPEIRHHEAAFAPPHWR